MTDTQDPRSCLTLAFPAVLEEEILDICHEMEGIEGFTILSAAGFGQGAVFRSVQEEVRGRAARRLLMTVTYDRHVKSLLAELARRLPTPDVAYWITPVIGFGRLA
ncbi:MAG: DUF3240 family protein [Proteobacteria bacterium]|nr:DUF3240 family protein [Pseudomonadota bacterium]